MRAAAHPLDEMSFQAYLDNIQAKTGKTPNDSSLKDRASKG